MHFHTLNRAASAVMVMACLAVATGRQLPCDSVLRRLPSFSHLFAHCECLYSQWTDWVAINRTAVPTSQCPSGSALIRERRQVVISGECDDIVQTNTTCEPEMMERLILALGLGSSGWDITPGVPINNCRTKRRLIQNYNVTTPPPPGCGFNRFSRDTEQVCHQWTAEHKRRSVREEKKKHRLSQHHSTPEPEPLPIDPSPFKMQEHLGRYRRRSCDIQQHILFVLDTSGSIREENFERVTSLLGDLTPLFCKPINFAVMTFDHQYFVEFCFDEYDNTDLGRASTGDDIRSIPYIREGQGSETRWTHTAGAAQCVCNYMLTHACDLPGDASCIDVVFITDGHANDPHYNVCTEIKCLHNPNRRGVNTFAIGIGNVHELKLDCMIETDDLAFGEYHLFNFPTFEELETQFDAILQRLFDPDPEDPYPCAATDVLIQPVNATIASPTGCLTQTL